MGQRRPEIHQQRCRQRTPPPQVPRRLGDRRFVKTWRRFPNRRFSAQNTRKKVHASNLRFTRKGFDLEIKATSCKPANVVRTFQSALGVVIGASKSNETVSYNLYLPHDKDVPLSLRVVLLEIEAFLQKLSKVKFLTYFLIEDLEEADSEARNKKINVSVCLVYAYGNEGTVYFIRDGLFKVTYNEGFVNLQELRLNGEDILAEGKEKLDWFECEKVMSDSYQKLPAEIRRRLNSSNPPTSIYLNAQDRNDTHGQARITHVLPVHDFDDEGRVVFRLSDVFTTESVEVDE